MTGGNCELSTPQLHCTLPAAADTTSQHTPYSMPAVHDTIDTQYNTGQQPTTTLAAATAQSKNDPQYLQHFPLKFRSD